MASLFRSMPSPTGFPLLGDLLKQHLTIPGMSHRSRQGSLGRMQFYFLKKYVQTKSTFPCKQEKISMCCPGLIFSLPLVVYAPQDQFPLPNYAAMIHLQNIGDFSVSTSFKISVFNFHWKRRPFYKARDGAFLPLKVPGVTLQLCISSSRGSLCSFKSTQLAFLSQIWLCIYVLVQQATCQKMILSITEVELEVQTMAFYFRSCEC